MDAPSVLPSVGARGRGAASYLSRRVGDFGARGLRRPEFVFTAPSSCLPPCPGFVFTAASSCLRVAVVWRAVTALWFAEAPGSGTSTEDRLPTRCRGRGSAVPVPVGVIKAAFIVRGQRVRRLFTPHDARADFILYPCRSPHRSPGGVVASSGSDAMWLHAHGPCACSRQGPSISAQGVRKWEGQKSRPSATRAPAAPRPERTNKAFVFLRLGSQKGGIRCSDAVQAMAAWLARCGRVPVQRAARSHATVSGSPIREELGR